MIQLLPILLKQFDFTCDLYFLSSQSHYILIDPFSHPLTSWFYQILLSAKMLSTFFHHPTNQDSIQFPFQFCFSASWILSLFQLHNLMHCPRTPFLLLPCTYFHQDLQVALWDKFVLDFWSQGHCQQHPKSFVRIRLQIPIWVCNIVHITLWIGILIYGSSLTPLHFVPVKFPPKTSFVHVVFP